MTACRVTSTCRPWPPSGCGEKCEPRAIDFCKCGASPSPLPRAVIVHTCVILPSIHRHRPDSLAASDSSSGVDPRSPPTHCAMPPAWGMEVKGFDVHRVGPTGGQPWLGSTIQSSVDQSPLSVFTAFFITENSLSVFPHFCPPTLLGHNSSTDYRTALNRLQLRMAP